MNTPLAPNIENIPAELKRRDAWVVWKGKKVPFDPKSPTHPASAVDPGSWGTFEQALRAYAAGGFSGFGVVLNDDGLVGVDIDNCVSDGEPSREALALVDRLNPAYLELSPSGKGLRMFGYGDSLSAGVNGKHDGLKAEFYSGKRYLTITGQTLKNEPLRALSNFAGIAQQFRGGTGRAVAPFAHEDGDAEERHGQWIKQVISGEIYHDALRNLAASYIATGMKPSLVTANLRALMDSVRPEKDDRWSDRYKQIPALVQSAFEKYATHGFADATARKGRYSPVGSAELRALPHPTWRVKGVMPKAGLAAVFGPPGSGKSFLCLSLAAAIADGGEWFGHKVNSAAVLYVCLEGEGGMKQRAAAWEQQQGVFLPERLGIVLDSFKVNEPQDVADLADALEAGGVVFIDTLNRAAPEADENNSKDMGIIIEGAKALQQKSGGLVVLVHHTGKDPSKGLRGHSSLLAALDAAIEVVRNANNREWRVSKSKDGRDGVSQAFNLETVLVGTDDDGDPVTSCVIVPTVQNTLKKPPRGQTLEVLLALKDAAFDAASDEVTEADWRRAFYERARCGDGEAQRKAFWRARLALCKGQWVRECAAGYKVAEFSSVA